MSYSNFNGGRYPPRVKKWWTPKDDKQKRLFEAAKEDVKCYLTIHIKEGIKARNAFSKMAVDMETSIPFQEMGFKTFGEFLFHLNDVMIVKSDGYNDYLFLRDSAAEDELSHLQELASKQRKAVGYKGFRATKQNTHYAPFENLLHINYDLRVDANPPPAPRRRGGSNGRRQPFRVRDNLPKPPTLREVKPGLKRLVESALCEDEYYDSDDNGMEAITGNVEMSKTYIPPEYETGKWEGESDSEGEDEFDSAGAAALSTPSASSSNYRFSATTTTTSTLPKASEVTATKAAINHPPPLSNLQVKTTIPSTGPPVLKTIPRSKKRIYKKLPMMQMKIDSTEMSGDFLGCDEYGYLYVKPHNIDKYFSLIDEQLQAFYKDTNNQRDFLMQPNEMEAGVFVVFFLAGRGFFRGRIDRVCPEEDMKICYVFAIDFCDFYMVKWTDIYHIEPKFTSRHPRVVQLILRGTENLILNNHVYDSFVDICSRAFPTLTQAVEVSNISPINRMFRAPIVNISVEGQDLLKVLQQYGTFIPSNGDFTLLTPRQLQVLKELEKKSHVAPAE